MMRTRSLVVVLVLMLLAPLPLLAQQGGGQRGGMGGFMGARALLEQGSVDFLASRAAELQLTADQTTALKAIGARWSETTRESRERIQAEMPQGGPAMGGGDREAMRARMQALQPHMQKLREEDDKATAEALALLNENQQAAARKLIEERMQPRRPGGF